MIEGIVVWLCYCLVGPIIILFLTWPLWLCLYLGYSLTLGGIWTAVWLSTGVFGSFLYVHEIR